MPACSRFCRMRRLSQGLALALTGAVGLAACETTSNEPPGVIETPDDQLNPFRDAGYVLDWTVGNPRGRADIDILQPTDGLLFIHDDRNVLTARDAGTGRIRWSVSMGSELARIVGVELVGGRVYSFSTADVQILDVDSGSLVDRQKLEVLVNTEPLNDWPLFVFGTVTGEVLAHDGSIGFKEWGYQLEGRITQPAVDTGSAIGVVSQGGQFVLLDPRTGRRFGRIQEMFDGAGAEPVTDGRTVFIASLDQSLYAFDAADATERWRLRTEYPLTDQPVVHRGVVYQAVPFRGLVAIGAARGDIRWTADDVFGRVVRIDRDADELLVWDGRHLVTVGMERGDERSRREVPGVARLIATDLVGGDLYTEYADGRLSKFILSP